jgi:Toxin SymE, type I toxin-antitoxin system
MTRRIKVEQLGDPAHKRTHAGIRLKGKWLERLGFQPGGHVDIVCTQPGLMEIRFTPRP